MIPGIPPELTYEHRARTSSWAPLGVCPCPLLPPPRHSQWESIVLESLAKWYKKRLVLKPVDQHIRSASQSQSLGKKISGASVAQMDNAILLGLGSIFFWERSRGSSPRTQTDKAGVLLLTHIHSPWIIRFKGSYELFIEFTRKRACRDTPWHTRRRRRSKSGWERSGCCREGAGRTGQG